jgi:uncharacterized protein with HEPN domain
MQQRDEATLLQIAQACADIVRLTEPLTRRAFDESPAIAIQVVYWLQVVGEGARRISLEARAANPEIPWQDMIALRNVLVHQYDEIDFSVVWRVAHHEIPDVLRAVLMLLPEQ